MSYTLVFKEEARHDILQVSNWYADEAENLDVRFIAHIESTLKIIRNNPKIFKRVYKNFRQAALNKFPYVILYEYSDDTIIVFSVFNTSQHPRKKIKRLRK